MHGMPWLVDEPPMFPSPEGSWRHAPMSRHSDRHACWDPSSLPKPVCCTHQMHAYAASGKVRSLSVLKPCKRSLIGSSLARSASRRPPDCDEGG